MRLIVSLAYSRKEYAKMPHDVLLIVILVLVARILK